MIIKLARAALLLVGIWGLLLVTSELRRAPVEAAEPEATSTATSVEGSERLQAAGQQAAPPTDEARSATGTRAPTSTLPLRWRVSWAALETGTFDTWCATAVVVTNVTEGTIGVEVEWINGSVGASVALRPLDVPAQSTRVWIGGNPSQVNNVPWFANDVPSLNDFQGYALVTADDPRIMVSAFQFCRTGPNYLNGETVTSQVNIPTFPVGSTAELFVAGVPAAPVAPAPGATGPR